ncbi:hypothetical protein FBZ84_101192 [Azospirillum baldaniorum]|uniref:hypothetical protein n=1 Tax=Azospirillum baldaniorum TaxID=1064539 RepID=UPI00119EB987|nr:hypothetical protein [Azospirillum baldaniorum]TWA71926.1 hypothetical protein FBZ84_101192 [Azospirillum baldaniorum]
MPRIVASLRLYAAQVCMGWAASLSPKGHPEGEAIILGIANITKAQMRIMGRDGRGRWPRPSKTDAGCLW